MAGPAAPVSGNPSTLADMLARIGPRANARRSGLNLDPEDLTPLASMSMSDGMQAANFDGGESPIVSAIGTAGPGGGGPFRLASLTDENEGEVVETQCPGGKCPVPQAATAASSNYGLPAGARIISERVISQGQPSGQLVQPVGGEPAMGAIGEGMSMTAPPKPLADRLADIDAQYPDRFGDRKQMYEWNVAHSRAYVEEAERRASTPHQYRTLQDIAAYHAKNAQQMVDPLVQEAARRNDLLAQEQQNKAGETMSGRMQEVAQAMAAGSQWQGLPVEERAQQYALAIFRQQSTNDGATTLDGGMKDQIVRNGLWLSYSQEIAEEMRRAAAANQPLDADYLMNRNVGQLIQTWMTTGGVKNLARSNMSGEEIRQAYSSFLYPAVAAKYAQLASQRKQLAGGRPELSPEELEAVARRADGDLTAIRSDMSRMAQQRPVTQMRQPQMLGVSQLPAAPQQPATQAPTGTFAPPSLMQSGASPGSVVPGY